MIDIVGLGCVAVDDFLYTESPAVAGEKARVIGRRRQIGGLTALALQAAARLGSTCSFEGLLGSHDEWAFVDEELAELGVTTSFAPRREDVHPVLSTIAVAPSGERTIFFDDSSPAGPDDTPDLSRVGECAVLLLDGHGVPGAIVAAEFARNRGIPIVADCETIQHPRSRELLDLVDHLILPAAFAMAVTGTSSPSDAAEGLGGPERTLAAVTDGANGLFHSAGGDPARHMPAFPVEAIDTTGCGDVFHGAYASAIARGVAPLDSLRFASAAAAVLSTRRGGPERLPNREEVDELLATAPLPL
ncbi:permease [Planotetraspora silvatica]|uniref:Permease n=1 Tax=Planotetraspora silvatica TaxID=234614 RepID=A0A8J3XNT9_9ACTN|nr:PfkB family carbohydrate kinase [Planotetraspora silvatica]GII47570.1 permease [Planotetraspora silvatica]